MVAAQSALAPRRPTPANDVIHNLNGQRLGRKGRDTRDRIIEVAQEIIAEYDEAPVARHLKQKEIEIGVDLGLGSGHATVWTCDLTHGYISINADYRS